MPRLTSRRNNVYFTACAWSNSRCTSSDKSSLVYGHREIQFNSRDPVIFSCKHGLPCCLRRRWLPHPFWLVNYASDAEVNPICKRSYYKIATSCFTSVCGCLLYTSPSPRDGLLSRM